jgi:hypothetical protein
LRSGIRRMERLTRKLEDEDETPVVEFGQCFNSLEKFKISINQSSITEFCLRRSKGVRG